MKIGTAPSGPAFKMPPPSEPALLADKVLLVMVSVPVMSMPPRSVADDALPSCAGGDWRYDQVLRHGIKHGDGRRTAWQDTYATLHMWMQIVGKIRLAQMPWINHSWHVTLYVTGRGLTTSPIPYGARTFQIDFDFIDHRLVIDTDDGTRRALELRPRARTRTR